jgi:hypothetical protein
VNPVDPALNVLTIEPPATAIAAVVVLTVCPFWTIGTISLPVREPAAGKFVIVTCADIILGSVDMAQLYPDYR